MSEQIKKKKKKKKKSKLKKKQLEVAAEKGDRVAQAQKEKKKKRDVAASPDPPRKKSKKKKKKRKRQEKEERPKKRRKVEHLAGEEDLELVISREPEPVLLEGATRGDEKVDEENRDEEKVEEEKEESIRDTVNYLETLEGVVKEAKFSNPDEPSIISENVFEEIEGKEKSLLFNSKAAYSIEAIVSMESLTEHQVRVLMHKCDGDWVGLSCNKGSSHTIQVMLARVAEKLAQGYDETNLPVVDLPTLQQEFEFIIEEFTGNLCHLLRSTYGSFVLRDALHILSGARKLADKHGTKNKRFGVKRQRKVQRVAGGVPALFSRKLASWAGEAAGLADFQSLVYRQQSAPVLSVLVECLRATGQEEACDSLCRAILGWGADGGDEARNSFVRDCLVDVSASHLLERVCQSCSQELAEQIFDRHFKPEIVALSFNKCANYCVQKILLRLKDKERVQSAYDELFPKFGDLHKRNQGVIWAVIESCAAVNHQFNDIVTKVANLARVPEPSKLFQRLIQDRTQKYSTMGCLILTALLKFRTQEVTSVLYGMLEFAEVNRRDLTCHPTLSRVFDQGLKAFTKGRLRQKLARTVLEDFEGIAVSEFGSYSVENSFWSANMKNKRKIAEELSGRWNRFSGNKFASRILDNLLIEVYRKKPKEWEDRISKRQKDEKWKSRGRGV